MDVEVFNNLLGVGALLIQAVTALLVIVSFSSWREKLFSFAGHYGLMIAFCAAFAGALGSFVYSEIIGYVPCVLCWWQRVFLFPQFIILGVALFGKIRNADVFFYTLALSIIGGAIALYHVLLQAGTGLPALCSFEGTSCSQRLVFVFDYVTIPMMALSIFAFLIVVSLIMRRSNKI